MSLTELRGFVERVFSSLGIDGARGIYVKTGAAFFLTIVFMAISYGMTIGTERAATAKKNELVAFNAMREEYLHASRSVAPAQKRLKQSQSKESTGVVFEEIAGMIGIRGNVASFKAMDLKPEKGYSQNGVEVKINGVGFNQVLNLIYRTETHKNLLLTKDFLMVSHFENPELFDVTMKVVMVTRKNE